MKKAITFMALLSLLNLAFIAIPGPTTAKEANSIDELVAMYDDSKCAKCHEEIYKQWQNSWHSKAVISSLKGMRNFIAIGLAKEWQRPLTKAQVLKCLDCHAPAVNFASIKSSVLSVLIITSGSELLFISSPNSFLALFNSDQLEFSFWLYDQ